MRAGIHFIALLMGVLLSTAAVASDYAREKKWADEILPAVLVGDPVWLKDTPEHQFLALYTETANAKGAVILGHGSGVHPDWGLIGMLRQRLADMGYTTLSIQFPVLAADAKSEAYVPTFGNAAQRVAKAVDFLKGKGYGKIAIVSHSLGGRMTYPYLSGKPDTAVKAWVALSTGDADNWGKLKLPILDLYGQNDFPDIKKNAALRAKGLTQPGSTQKRLENADHFYEGQDDALTREVGEFLARQL